MTRYAHHEACGKCHRQWCQCASDQLAGDFETYQREMLQTPVPPEQPTCARCGGELGDKCWQGVPEWGWLCNGCHVHRDERKAPALTVSVAVDIPPATLRFDGERWSRAEPDPGVSLVGEIAVAEREIVRPCVYAIDRGTCAELQHHPPPIRSVWTSGIAESNADYTAFHYHGDKPQPGDAVELLGGDGYIRRAVGPVQRAPHEPVYPHVAGCCGETLYSIDECCKCEANDR